MCRLCGEVSLDSNAERCPHCGQWGTARSRIRPIYWMRESTPGEAVDRLRRTAAVVRGMLADPSDPRWQQPSVPGEWTAHQVLEHLHNAQRVFRGRIDQLVAGGEPLLTSVMVWTIESGGGSTAELLDAYSALRAEIVGVLEGVSSADWWNRGRHEEWGVVTLAEQASYFANHEPTHLGQLAAAIGDGPADH